jgi:hypothetical protein
MMTTIEILRIMILILIISVCMFRIAFMSKQTCEAEAWGFILITIGSVWRIAAIVHYNSWLPNVDADIHDDLAYLVLSSGVLLLVVSNSWPWIAATLKGTKYPISHRRSNDKRVSS